MSANTRAWRFSFRPIDERGRDAGLALTVRGGVELVNEADAVRQAILLLVSTRPGERVMRPDYGCHLFRLAFAPNDDTTAGLAIHYVRAALARWEPRIAVLKLDAVRNLEHKSRLDIDLQYRLRSRAGSEQLALTYDLFSGRVF
jgi:hypothetical protein